MDSTIATDRAPRVRVAYLVSRYPALSHSFIEREVLALRALGAEVHTFSVRPSPVDAQLSVTSQREAEGTYALLGRPRRDYLRAHGSLWRRAPRAWWAGVRAAMRTGPGGLKPRVWQMFYLAEAVLLGERMRELGLRHVHVHFANNGADVARSVVTMGRAEEGADAGWKWSFSMHGPTEFEDPEGHDLPAKVRSAEHIACISDFCRDQLRQLSAPEHWAKMSIVRMGVDASRFAPDPGAREAGAEEQDAAPLRILFVGRLVPEKGPNILVDAVEHLHGAGVPVELVVAGAGVLAEDLARQVEASPARDSIRLLGPVGQDDLRQWYAWADVFCLPSYAEGVPVVLMEAMSMELPVVSTRIAGIPELIRDGETGLLVPPGQREALVHALKDLAEHPDLRRSLGVAGRRRVEEEFQPGPNARRLLSLFTATAAAHEPEEVTA